MRKPPTLKQIVHDVDRARQLVECLRMASHAVRDGEQQPALEMLTVLVLDKLDDAREALGDLPSAD